MRFAAFSYVYLLGAVPALLALYLYAFARKRQSLAMFLNLEVVPRLVPGLSRRRQWLKALCLIGAFGCLILALMQPQWGIRWQDVPSQGRDLMLILDVSRSMLAEDVVPNRLERAKAYIRDLVQVVQKEGGHRLGLVVFAGRATLHCPLTRDHAFFLQRLNEVGPDTIAPGGTAIGHAIRQALQSFTTDEHAYKDIILLTDGEDHHSLPLEAAQTAAAQHVSLYIIGLGNPEVGARIPFQDTQGRRTYLQYDGQEVRSRQDQHLLLEMARLTGGVYVLADTRSPAMERLYTGHIAPKARRHIDATASEYLIHRYQWFVGAALFLLAVEMLLRERTVKTEGS
jgi:Ca-activated chloride channel homolog